MQNQYPQGQQASGQIAHTANKKTKLSLAGPVENAAHLKLKTNDFMFINIFVPKFLYEKREKKDY